MFSSKLIIYLKRNALEVYNQKAEGTLGRLEFPTDTATDEEVISESKFEELISSFLTKLSPKENKALIILSDEVIFTKTIPITDEKTEEKQARDFFAEVPFDAEKLAEIIVKTKNGVNLFATNKHLFWAIATVLSKMQKATEAVVPAALFGITQDALTKKDIQKVTANGNLIEASNFLDSPQVKNAQEPQNPESQKTEDDESQTVEKTEEEPVTRNYFVIVGVIIIIVGSLVALFLYKKPNIKNFKLPPISFFSKKSASPTTSSSMNSTPSPSAQEQASKDQITVQILNGTGKASQASEVKGIFAGLGYSQIETGNAETQDNETTIVDFSKKVPTDMRQEIINELEKTFTEIKMNVDVNQNFDVIVTTGSQK